MEGMYSVNRDVKAVSNKRKACSITPNEKSLKITVNASVLKGPHKSTCEDNCKVSLDLGSDISSFGKGIAFFAIIDGHGGRMAVDWAVENMACLFCQCLARNLKNIQLESLATLGDEKARTLIISSMYNAFAHAEHILCTMADESGVCLLICLHFRDHILCFNSGDCGAVYQRTSGVVESLNVLHDGDCPGEYDWVISSGAEFKQGRVGGIVEPTRTLGDIDAKRLHPTAISHTPDVFITQISSLKQMEEGADSNPHSSDMLVMCSDGVHGPYGGMTQVAAEAREWEFLSHADVDSSLGSTALKVTTSAIGEKKRGSDDVSAVVVFLRYIEEHVHDGSGQCDRTTEKDT